MEKLILNSIYGEWGNDYDKPIHTIERTCQKILQYELIGLGKDHIIVTTEFINKTKELFLIVTGKFNDAMTGFENEINIRLQIDTNIYCSYDYKIENGLLTITLFEKINEVPEFHKVG